MWLSTVFNFGKFYINFKFLTINCIRNLCCTGSVAPTTLGVDKTATQLRGRQKAGVSLSAKMLEVCEH